MGNENMNDQWFSKFTTNVLSFDEDFRIENLEKFKLIISPLNSNELKHHVLPNCYLEQIFECLNTSNKKQFDLTLTILKKFLSVLEPIDVLSKFGVHLGRVIEFSDVEAKKLVLNELNRGAKDDLVSVKISDKIPLLLSVIDCIKSEDLSLAVIAVECLSELGKINSTCSISPWYSCPVLYDHLEKICVGNDIVRHRVYEIFVNISIHSADKLKSHEIDNILSRLLNELHSNDILLQLTSIETITKLALCDHGLQFLKHKNVLRYIGDQLSNPDVLNSLLVSGFIKFFGNVAQMNPQEVFETYPHIIDLSFQLHNSNDIVLSNIALETIGYIATNPLGKFALNKYGSHMDGFMETVGKIIELQLTERKVIALNVLMNVLKVQKSADQVFERNIMNITNRWFSQLSDNPMKMLKDVCVKPIMELKLAGLSALQVVATQRWGPQEIEKSPGLIEYLLDRNEESDMSCKTAKFNIIETLYKSRYWSPNPEIDNKLKTYLQQGICYAETKTLVAFEDAT